MLLAATVGVSAGYSAFGEDKLPHTHPLCTKSTGAALQIQFPHPTKSLTVPVFQPVPSGVETLEPGHQRPVIVTAVPGVEIFKDEVLSDATDNVADGRKLHARHDVFVVPGIDGLLFQISDSM